MKNKILTFLIFIIFSKMNYASNKAYDLTASGINYLTTATAPLSGNMAFTIEFWFNSQGVVMQDYSRLIGFENNACELGLASSALVVFDGSSWWPTVSTNIKSGWHHVVITSNATNYYVFLDGVQVFQRAASFNFTNKKMFIGINKDLQANQRVRAFYDEVRIWSAYRSLSTINLYKGLQLVGNETNLISYYKMDDLNNAASGITNLTKVGNASPKYFPFGLYLNDYYIFYDGKDAKYEYPSAASIINNDFTIEVNFKNSDNSTTYRRIIGSDSFRFELALSSGELATYISGWSSTYAINMNEAIWHHVAVVKSGTNLRIYLDGSLVQEKVLNITNFVGSIYFGGRYLTSPESFSGELDEIKIWNVARTQAQIISTMDTLLEGNETNLVAYYDFNTVSISAINLVDGGVNMTRHHTQSIPITYIVSLPKEYTTSVIDYQDVSKCSSGATSMTLSAIPRKGVINWYASATSTNPLATGNTFSTPSISTNTTYYVDATYDATTTRFRVPIVAKILAVPDNSVSVAESQLTSNADGVTYQWINCNGIAVNGATNKVFIPNVTGNYAVIVTNGDCSDTSNCIAINNVGVENLAVSKFHVYPNPSDGVFFISNIPEKIKSFNVSSMLGEFLFNVEKSGDIIKIDLTDFSNGLYLVQMINDEGKITYIKIIKQ